MALPIPYGVDPDETWEIDLTRVLAERGIELGRAVARNVREKAAKETDAKKRTELEAVAKASEDGSTKLEADVAAYVPGSGPVFTVGPIPNGKRGAVAGEGVELSRLTDARERGERDDAWSAEVVRWAVRGHRNLRRRDGTEIPFISEAVKWVGVERQVVSAKTLEAYGPFLGDLALAILESQRLDEARKNG